MLSESGYQKIFRDARTMADQMHQSGAEVGATMEKVFTLNRDFAFRDFKGSGIRLNLDVTGLQTNLNTHGVRRDGFWYEVEAIETRQLKVTCRRHV